MSEHETLLSALFTEFDEVIKNAEELLVEIEQIIADSEAEIVL